jgi:TonB family protein
MRRWNPIFLVALCVGMVIFSHPCSPAQDQAEAKRKIVNRVPPLYPDLARRMQIRGTVKVQVVVAADGKVKLTEVVGGSPLLAKAAVDALGKWKWEAAGHETKELVELNFHPE